MKKKACFIGHRRIADTPELRERIRSVLIKLIEKENVIYFLFGSKSDFDTLCHAIVTELQIQYPCIKRIAYTCRSEAAVMKNEKNYIEERLSQITKKTTRLKDYDTEYEHPTKLSSGRAGYIERNQAMINDSDISIFYYDDKYQPPRRKLTQNALSDYQPKSGTHIAYDYAVHKKKTIINIYKQ